MVHEYIAKKTLIKKALIFLMSWSLCYMKWVMYYDTGLNMQKNWHLGIVLPIVYIIYSNTIWCNVGQYHQFCRKLRNLNVIVWATY